MDIKIVVLSLVLVSCYTTNGGVIEPTPKPLFGENNASNDIEGKEGNSEEDYGMYPDPAMYDDYAEYEEAKQNEAPKTASVSIKKQNPFAFLNPEELLNNPDFQAFLASKGKVIGPSAPKPTPGQVFTAPTVFNPLIPQRLENIDFCPKHAEQGMKYYCMNLHDGLYFDPWNPWCGYMQCMGGGATRVVCPKGTWMGMRNAVTLTTKDMCRMALTIVLGNDGECPARTDFTSLCRNAERKDGIVTATRSNSNGVTTPSTETTK